MTTHRKGCGGINPASNVGRGCSGKSMLTLDISQAVFLYLLLTVIGVLILWIFFEEKLKFVYFREEDIYIWQCDICIHLYVDSLNRDISKCPRCNSFNVRKEKIS
jgi:hypothetical protein